MGPLAIQVRPISYVDGDVELEGLFAFWQIRAYGQTTHALTNPNANDANRGVMYHPDADRRSWQAIESFLGELLR